MQPLPLELSAEIGVPTAVPLDDQSAVYGRAQVSALTGIKRQRSAPILMDEFDDGVGRGAGDIADTLLAQVMLAQPDAAIVGDPLAPFPPTQQSSGLDPHVVAGEQHRLFEPAF